MRPVKFEKQRGENLSFSALLQTCAWLLYTLSKIIEQIIEGCTMSLLINDISISAHAKSTRMLTMIILHSNHKVIPLTIYGIT